MILVTVGMQLGFDRLIEAMDKLAPDLDQPIIAQTGKGSYSPRHMEARIKIAPADFEEMVEQSSLIVSHAGIGTVLTAARFGKPVLLMPRRAALGEHRNDHQLATVRNLEGRPGILVAMDETELADRICEGLSLNEVTKPPSPPAEQLQSAITRFIETGNL
ncbi:glycosyltransferase [uncultured Erythrobacter sp.]|uniref:glycosyltransferase n=1 Tax=uncultured Erythrobacter sp. TaxID=263913 RepID=UPI00261CB826|nr:glycosyltransferase [uncultured Erythrobacter sp.]